MNIRLATLTPVHIGTGRQLQYGAEYLSAHVDGMGKMAHVIDDRKVLDIIGTDNIDGWAELISRKGDLAEYITSISPTTVPSEYSLRSMELHCDVRPGDSLKECIHDGMGRPYLPGSSLKGAIRTAILATDVYDIKNKEKKIVIKNKDKKDKITSSIIEEELFGMDANQSIFRLIRIGDAFFPEGSEEVRRLQMYLNITKSRYLHPLKNTKPMLAEVLKPGLITTLRMHVDLDLYDKFQKLTAIKQTEVPMAKLPRDLDSMRGLFYYINCNTQYLLEREIEFWEELDPSGRKGSYSYIEQLKDLLLKVNECCEHDDDECILRVGHASGWDFITGAWTRHLSNFEDKVVNAARKKNYNYQDYPFPKSRRLDSEGGVLGFVKLSIYHK